MSEVLLSSWAGSEKSTGLTDQALRIRSSAYCLLIKLQVLSVYTFCIGKYREGRSLNVFQLSCNLFGIIPVMDSTNGVISTAFSYRIRISSSFKSVYFWSLSVIVLRGLLAIGISTSAKYASLMVNLSKITPGLLLWMVRSVILDRS
jgi:hypothetical protein